MKTLRVILTDQLSHSIATLEKIDPKKDRILMMEAKDELTNVPHHPKKIAFLLSAMRHFSKELQKKGYAVDYIKWTDKESLGSLSKTLEGYLKDHSFDEVLAVQPAEWRILQDLKSVKGAPITILEDNRFFCSMERFRKWAGGKKTLLMEHFYRMLRKEEDILLDQSGDPEGGEWNFDKENRKPLKDKVDPPRPMQFTPDKITKETIKEVQNHFSDHFGTINTFWFGVTASEARRALAHFIRTALPKFGDYQDAMVDGEPFLFHSILSQYLNAGLLLPREVCEAVEKAYREEGVPVNCAEGFLRQVLGWREYVRGVYWTRMPKYAELNALKAERPLPKLYWGGETEMNCMRQVVKQTEEEAHSHHIQRLMVTGNFALIAGLDPKEVCEWYLSVYADAYDWVELPNTLGMALFGDGGILGTKPYAASGSYINRMSNFCKGCKFTVKKRTGEDACPFNFLYWDFLMRHEKRFRKNQRMKMVLSHIDKMEEKEKKEIKEQAKTFLEGLE